MSAPVEVTWIDMDAGEDACLAAFWRTLGADERERAGRFRFERDRRRFIIRRGALRALLARRLGCAASAIGYSCNEFGKPSLAASGVRFNVSHSRAIALYAIAEGVEVGCDIERVDSALDIEAIAERFFAPPEIRMLQALPDHLRRAGFFNCWTRKEAYLKCRGWGLSAPPDSCVVSLAPGEPAQLLAGDDGISLSSLETVPGYRAALAVEAMDVEISETSAVIAARHDAFKSRSMIRSAAAIRSATPAASGSVSSSRANARTFRKASRSAPQPSVNPLNER